MYETSLNLTIQKGGGGRLEEQDAGNHYIDRYIAYNIFFLNKEIIQKKDFSLDLDFFKAIQSCIY